MTEIILRLSGDIFGLPQVNVKYVWIYKIHPDIHPYISGMYVLDLIFTINFNIKINFSDNFNKDPFLPCVRPAKVFLYFQIAEKLKKKIQMLLLWDTLIW